MEEMSNEAVPTSNRRASVRRRSLVRSSRVDESAERDLVYARQQQWLRSLDIAWFSAACALQVFDTMSDLVSEGVYFWGKYYHRPPNAGGGGGEAANGTAVSADEIGLAFDVPVVLEAALAGFVQIFIGQRFYRGAWAALRQGAANMEALVALENPGEVKNLRRPRCGWEQPFEPAAPPGPDEAGNGKGKYLHKGPRP